jgi:hypothetical protein
MVLLFLEMLDKHSPGPMDDALRLSCGPGGIEDVDGVIERKPLKAVERHTYR